MHFPVLLFETHQIQWSREDPPPFEGWAPDNRMPRLCTIFVPCVNVFNARKLEIPESSKV